MNMVARIDPNIHGLRPEFGHPVRFPDIVPSIELRSIATLIEIGRSTPDRRTL
jgi:hypothetical protein